MFEELRNNIDFYIRNCTKFSRKNFVEKNPSIIKNNEQENLYVYDVLNKYFQKTSCKNLNVLDIGCKNWYYLKGEHKFFKEFSDDFHIDGVELDAYRLYSNFYSRYETAKFYMKDFNNAKYIPDNLLNLKSKYDYIIWILPFVLKEPLTAWGLPKKFFCPEKLLKHAYSLLNQNGQMLILNQKEIEAEEQKKLLEKLNINYKYLGEIKSKFYEYPKTRYGYLIKKESKQ